LTVVDGEYLLYQPRIKQAVEGKLSSGGKKGLFSGILTGSPEALEELEHDYVAEGLGETRLAGTNVIELRFTAQPNAAVYCQRIDLWIDTLTWLPVQQSCHEANQSVITFTLRDVELNLPLHTDAFDVELPSDVERLRG
jgi:outer membrane lipoprotein-sorting protein